MINILLKSAHKILKNTLFSVLHNNFLPLTNLLKKAGFRAEHLFWLFSIVIVIINIALLGS